MAQLAGRGAGTGEQVESRSREQTESQEESCGGSLRRGVRSWTLEETEGLREGPSLDERLLHSCDCEVPLCTWADVSGWKFSDEPEITIWVSFRRGLQPLA